MRPDDIGELAEWIEHQTKRSLFSLVTLLRNTADDIERAALKGATTDIRTLRPTIEPMIGTAVNSLCHLMGNASVRIPIGSIEEYADAVRDRASGEEGETDGA